MRNDLINNLIRNAWRANNLSGDYVPVAMGIPRDRPILSLLAHLDACRCIRRAISAQSYERTKDSLVRDFNSREKWCRASKDTPQSDCGGIEIAGVKKFLALGVVDNEGTEITAFFDDKSLFSGYDVAVISNRPNGLSATGIKNGIKNNAVRPSLNGYGGTRPNFHGRERRLGIFGNKRVVSDQNGWPRQRRTACVRWGRFVGGLKPTNCRLRWQFSYRSNNSIKDLSGHKPKKYASNDPIYIPAEHVSFVNCYQAQRCS